ncbi:MAG: branched-chain amino acid ABC transporter permease [Betaproteobacteria bacterium]|uniref:branched-chain amino acid ABC transporter permease n=1 Tax=Ferrovum sp. PN-J185 TaxID=1356306 RepID=UPI00082D6FCC|nr:branched-chain amino acid ABC transporter permease [Ferrovum sp. PN-J185]MDE1892336.1 branched-chain amino acid ABC transporter permease [Betaproteobacteria bacterium]
MDIIFQYLINGLMLGIIYAMVAVGFTLFFGTLNVIQFSHGDVLTLGAFSGLASIYFVHSNSVWMTIFLILMFSIVITSIVGMFIARYLILPMRNAPSINILLSTLMFGTVIRESLRLFYPDGANPKRFPNLLPTGQLSLGSFSISVDNIYILFFGLFVIISLAVLINKTKLGLAIRAISQDSETAKLMGIPFNRYVLITFIIGSSLAAIAGVMDALYYNEINFSMGLLLGVIGFTSAIIGGLGNIYGAIIGGFLFAFLEVVGGSLIPTLFPTIPSAYKDVFAFTMVIILMSFKPTGLLPEKFNERV